MIFFFNLVFEKEVRFQHPQFSLEDVIDIEFLLRALPFAGDLGQQGADILPHDARRMDYVFQVALALIF